MITLSSPGSKIAHIIGFPDLIGVDTIASVVATVTDDDLLTVANEAPTSGAETVDGVAYASGEAVTLDITAASTYTKEVAYLCLALTLDSGGIENHKFKVLVLDKYRSG